MLRLLVQKYLMADVTPKRKAVKVDLPVEVDRAVEIEAVKRDIPKRQLVEEALRAYLPGLAEKSVAA